MSRMEVAKPTLPPIRPRVLRPGDTIGVVTPSAPIIWSPSKDPMAELEQGIDVLKELGFEVVLSEHALAEGDGRWDFRAGSAVERANDINAMFRDPSIRAVISSHGGHVANGVLPHLDYQAIADNPKIFMGFSNIVWLNLAIHASSGLVTFHGNMVIWHLGMDPSDYDLAEFRRVLVDGGQGIVPQNTQWRTVRDGPVGEGRLIGEYSGLSRLAGTPYALALDEDLILFEEGMIDTPGVAEVVINQLEQLGVFRRTRGLLIGNDGSAFTGQKPPVPLEELILDLTSEYDFPILKCDDFGHASPNTVLPIGVRARLDPTTPHLELLERAVV